MSYKKQIKNSVYEVPGDELAELLSMPDAVRTYTAIGFIRPGLASWGNEVIYVSPEVCRMMAWTLKGKPMTLEHPAGLITAENRDKYMIGAVTEVVAAEDGSFDAKFFIDPKTKDGEESIEALEWKEDTPPRISHVSCVYQVERWGDGGSLNGVKYDREVLAGTMLQLALTENPRYDGTWVVKNSNDDTDRVEYCAEEGGLDSQIKNDYNKPEEPKGNTMGFWKKNTVEVDEDLMIDTDLGAKSIKELVQIANSSVSLNAELESLRAQVANKDDEEKKDDDEEKDENQPKNDCDEENQPKNGCDDDQPKNEDEDKDEEEGGEKDQPKNSTVNLDAEQQKVESQVLNSDDDVKVESTVYDGMKRAEADFANK